MLQLNERINLCSKFDEGTEISDAVSSLVTAARVLNGLADKHNAQLALIAAEKVITDYVEWLRYDSGDYDLYQELDNDVFVAFSGGARKLTKEEFYG